MFKQNEEIVVSGGAADLFTRLGRVMRIKVKTTNDTDGIFLCCCPRIVNLIVCLQSTSFSHSHKQNSHEQDEG